MDEIKRKQQLREAYDNWLAEVEANQQQEQEQGYYCGTCKAFHPVTQPCERSVLSIKK